MKEKIILQTFWCRIVDYLGNEVCFHRVNAQVMIYIMRNFRIIDDMDRHIVRCPVTPFDKSQSFCPFKFIITSADRTLAKFFEKEKVTLFSELNAHISNLIYSRYV